jgi:NAD(P)-dependent dehydrogenase (short-subunit alcohol dehydrogenase family)
VKAQQVADGINKSGGQAIAVPGDMLDAEYIKVLVKKSAEFGGGKIHVIVNNAGFGSLNKIRLLLTFHTDILGTVLSTRYGISNTANAFTICEICGK